LAGEPDDLPWMQDWLTMIREATNEGRRFTRVQAVSLPLTDYNRFGLAVSRHNNAAGEDIRYLTRDQAKAVELPNHDYWLFDSRKLVLRPHQSEIAELDAKTRLFRVFEATVIPGLLQTAEYARARLAQGVILFKVRNDINEAVQARMKRQELLYRSDKRFHFVMTEAALRLRLYSPEVMLGQLDRLISLSALPNVKLGIIDSNTQYVVGPWHGFWLGDIDRVKVETFSAELNLAQPQEIELYSNIFDQFAAVASYGRSARAIITRLVDDLASETPEDVS
jgi:Domain of unknown function (DUF5753)